MLHPVIVHFAISLPLITLILGLASIYKPSELMSKISTRFMVVATLFIIAAYFSGKEDAGIAFEGLTAEGKEALQTHAGFALYLVIAMVLATLIKIFACVKKIFPVEIVSIVLVALTTLGILYQGKTGGDVTYLHGANVAKHADGMTCINDPEFYMDMME